MVSGAADNTLRLWNVATGKCLYTWEFPTAVKRVAFSEDDKQVVCITEQRMGHQCAIRVFNIDRNGEGTKRMFLLFPLIYFDYKKKQNQKNPYTCSTL
jgi:translation initiation factor 3 subunit I